MRFSWVFLIFPCCCYVFKSMCSPLYIDHFCSMSSTSSAIMSYFIISVVLHNRAHKSNNSRYYSLTHCKQNKLNVPKGKETHNIFSSVVNYSHLDAFIVMTFRNDGGRFFTYETAVFHHCKFCRITFSFFCQLLKQMDPFCAFDNKKGLFFSFFRHFYEAFCHWYGFCSKCERAAWAQNCYMQV